MSNVVGPTLFWKIHHVQEVVYFNLMKIEITTCDNQILKKLK